MLINHIQRGSTHTLRGINDSISTNLSTTTTFCHNQKGGERKLQVFDDDKDQPLWSKQQDQKEDQNIFINKLQVHTLNVKM